jgi:His/Glu/Gln/Arg/opine family amino acid ABC transporter permease subunit
MFERFLKLTPNDAFFFLRATGVTLGITLISITIGTVLGILFGIIRCSKIKLVSALPLIYIEPFRNSPLVVQLFLIYFGLPVVSNIIFSDVTAAIITLSLNTGAFFAVLVHNSIKSIPNAQWEAGYALGHSKLSVFIHIITPQSLRLLLPMAITLYINQLQCSSMVSLISMIDLCRTGQILSLRTFRPFLIWGIVFAIYFAISFPLAKLAHRIEKRIDFAY